MYFWEFCNYVTGLDRNKPKLTVCIGLLRKKNLGHKSGCHCRCTYSKLAPCLCHNTSNNTCTTENYFRAGGTLDNILIQGIPAFRDFTIRDPRYFMILFQWKSAKKVDFRNLFKVRILFVRFFVRFLIKNRTNRIRTLKFFLKSTFLADFHWKRITK